MEQRKICLHSISGRVLKKSIGASEEEVIESPGEEKPQSTPLKEIIKPSRGEAVIESVEEKPEEIKTLDLEELHKPSKGEELIQKIKEGDLYKRNQSAEIMDGEAIEKEKPQLDRHGLPVNPHRRNWDSI